MGAESGGHAPRVLLCTTGDSGRRRFPMARSGRATGARPRLYVRPRAQPPRACATALSDDPVWAAQARRAGAGVPRAYRSIGAAQANRSVQAGRPQEHQEELDRRGAGCDTASLWLDGSGGNETTTAASCAAPLSHRPLAGVDALLRGSTGDQQAPSPFFFAHPMTHGGEHGVGEEG